VARPRRDSTLPKGPVEIAFKQSLRLTPVAPGGKLGDLSAQERWTGKAMQNDQKSQEIPAPKRREPIFMLPAVITVLGVLMLAIQAASAFVLNESEQDTLILWLGFVP